MPNPTRPISQGVSYRKAGGRNRTERDFDGNKAIRRLKRFRSIIWNYPQNRTWQTIAAEGERILFRDLKFFTPGEDLDLPFQRLQFLRESFYE